MKTRIPHIRPALFAYATVLVAFFLRAYRLADKNIWWDEGWSIWLGQKDLAWIALRTAADEHPPLHYWMLHFWNALAGWNAFAGRYLSVMFAVLTIALVYRIGKRAGGATVGVLAALLLALARFHIWWSQDIKNYTPSILFAFAALWFGLDLLKRADRKGILGYAALAALALWTHYLAALVLLALNVYALFAFIRERREKRARLIAWTVANALGAIFFLPWLFVYLQNSASWVAAPPFDFALFLRLVATVLPLGVTTNIDNYSVVVIALTALAALGISARAQNGSRPAILFALVVILAPILIYVVSLTPVAFFAPKIQARYLLVLLPAYAILLALGILLLRRVSIYVSGLALVLVLAANLFALSDYYSTRRLTDEYASLTNAINAFAAQGDVVLLDTDQEWPTFLSYIRLPLEWLGAPNGHPMTDAEADSIVRRATVRGNAVWLVAIPDALATDAQRLVENRLAHALPKQYDQSFGDKRLALYAATPRDLSRVPAANFAPQYVRTERISEGVELLGFDLPVREIQPGDPLRVTTYWNALRSAEVMITVGSAATQTVRVPAGERVRVQTDFVVPPNIIGVLPLDAGEVKLAQVLVEPRAQLVVDRPISHPVDFALGKSIRLVGYDLPNKQVRAGDGLPLTLYWRASRQVDKNYTVFVHLLGEQFNPAQNNFLWGQVDHAPRAGTYPTTAWLLDEVVPDEYSVPVEPGAPLGKYKIEIGLYDPATGERLVATGGADSIILDQIEVQ